MLYPEKANLIFHIIKIYQTANLDDLPTGFFFEKILKLS